MRFFIILLFCSLVYGEDVFEVDNDEWGLEGYLFGVSWHRDDSLNSENYGGGLGLTFRDNVIFSVGGYKDSYGDVASFAMTGLRGNPYLGAGFHGMIGLSMGYYYGSGWKGLGYLPYVGLGYDRVTLCFSGFYQGHDSALALFTSFKIY